MLHFIVWFFQLITELILRWDCVMWRFFIYYYVLVFGTNLGSVCYLYIQSSYLLILGENEVLWNASRHCKAVLLKKIDVATIHIYANSIVSEIYQGVSQELVFRPCEVFGILVFERESQSQVVVIKG